MSHAMSPLEEAIFNYHVAKLDCMLADRRRRMLARRTHFIGMALSPMYKCACGWCGVHPDVTDTSEPHEDGGAIHISVCPKCGSARLELRPC